jgi:hypothetical protein
MMADRMAAGLHVGFQALTVAAAPATWGQAMDVPEMRLNCDGCFWPAGSDDVGIQDARMFTPGAATSGCIMQIHLHSLNCKAIHVDHLSCTISVPKYKFCWKANSAF